jgi:GNAT superfamily N-acetyltransferase
MLVREATSDDAQLIAELTRAAWAGKVAITSSGHRESADRVAQDLRDGGGFLLLKDDQPVGSVRWTPVAGEPQVWEVMRMGVLPEHRGQHLSQHLLEAVARRAHTVGINEMRLAVRADQPRLLDFYATFGFAVAPHLAYTHANPAEPAPMVMRRFLHD